MLTIIMGLCFVLPGAELERVTVGLRTIRSGDRAPSYKKRLNSRVCCRSGDRAPSYKKRLNSRVCCRSRLRPAIFIPAKSALADGDERLPGSRVDVQEAVCRAQIIVVTEVADVGSAKPGPPGIVQHLGVKLKPSRGLKGGTGTRELTLRSLEVLALPHEAAEAAPEKGTEYIVFIEQTSPETASTRYRGLKVLRATREDLDAVAAAQRREVRWPGSERNINDAARDATFIVVAKLVELGKDHMGPPASTSYDPSEIEVVRSLKGKAKEGLAPSFHVVTSPPEHAEHVPVPGDEYLIFIETRDGVAPHILKMMAATSANIQATEASFQRHGTKAR